MLTVNGVGTKEVSGGWTSTQNVPIQRTLTSPPADFDWSLIGARPWTNPEGETLIIHQGHTYRRRELEAVDTRKMKLPAAVKYSRGAKPMDPEHIREKADGEFEYVTLVMFRGGKRQERYAKVTEPQVRPAPARQAAAQAGSASPTRARGALDPQARTA